MLPKPSLKYLRPYVDDAVITATTLGHDVVTLEHLTVTLLCDPQIKKCLDELKIDTDLLVEELTIFFEAGFIDSGAGDLPHPSMIFNDLVVQTVHFARAMRRAEPNGFDLLLALLRLSVDDSFAVGILMKAGLTSLVLKEWMEGSEPVKEATPSPQIERSPVEFIKQFCTDLNARAAAGEIDPVIGRHIEIETAIHTLSRRRKNNVALVGNPGVGKSAIAEGIALRIVEKTVPETIRAFTLYSLDVGALVAGTRFRGDLEERLVKLIKAFSLLPNAILVIDEIHTIMGLGGGQGAADVSNLLKPALAKGQLRCIGTTTYEEFRKHFEKDRALTRRFLRLDVVEPDAATTLEILKGIQENYERYHEVRFTDKSLVSAVSLASRYLPALHFPDKAIDLLDAAGARSKIERRTLVEVEHIIREVAVLARLKSVSVGTDEVRELASLEATLKSKVIGQDKAVRALVDVIFVNRSGMRAPNKPAGAFLFAGPTGMGKTFLAQQLALSLDIPLKRYDMSEFMERHSVSKLIGSPPGYVGFGDGQAGSGRLINDVDANPRCIILLDEIEKAHPDVYNTFLQVMDDGRLTSSNGKTVGFQDVILIMTTNAGAAEMVKSPMGFGSSKKNHADSHDIKTAFSPEFRNRLDGIIAFDDLQKPEVRKIVDRLLEDIIDIAMKKAVILTVNHEVADWIADTGYDSQMGARPLNRVIHEKIRVPLSRMMIMGGLTDGGEAAISLVDGEINIALS